MSFCFFFNAISQKVLDYNQLEVLEKKQYETLCLLEMYFPPAFFDVSVHFTAHIVKEIKLLGPVFLHQMYAYERFNGILKSFVRNRAHPEGCMVQGYCTEEAIEWGLNYIDSTNPIGMSKSRHEGRLTGKGTIGKKSISPDRDLFDKAHFLVLQHATEVSEYMDEHKKILLQQNPERDESWLAKEHMRRFGNWFEHRIGSEEHSSQNLATLAMTYVFTVVAYQAYDINGYTFYTVRQDEKSSYQNSGVRVDAYDAKGELRPYYGQINEIWELDYGVFKVALSHCSWVNEKGVVKDKYRFTSVDLKSSGYIFFKF